MSNPVDVTVTVPCSFVGGTATVKSGDISDFCASAQFQSNIQTSSSARVTVFGDDTVELDETVTVELSEIDPSALRNVVFGDSQGTLTIENDDSATLRVFSRTLAEGDVGTRDFDFEVSLTADVDTTVSVDYETFDGTAREAASDYTPVSSSLVLSGTALEPEYVTVEVHGDTEVEQDETFTSRSATSTRADREVSFQTLEGNVDQAPGRILDDDSLFTDMFETGTLELWSTALP